MSVSHDGLLENLRSQRAELRGAYQHLNLAGLSSLLWD